MGRIWVPTELLATTLAGLPGAAVDVVVPDGGRLPESAAEAEFYVPPFFPNAAAVAALAQLPRLKVVQTLTAGVDRLLGHVPGGAVLCNARGVHDASTAEWVVAAILASVRQFPYFAAEQASARWSYRFTDCLAGKKVLIVGYGSIGAAVERRLSGFDVEVLRVARTARGGVSPVSEIPALLPDVDVAPRSTSPTRSPSARSTRSGRCRTYLSPRMSRPPRQSRSGRPPNSCVSRHDASWLGSSSPM